MAEAKAKRASGVMRGKAVAKRRRANGPGRAVRTTAAARRRFLEELALTANVTAAAKKAKLASTTVYRARAQDAAFRRQWHAALCEGYARLETELLAEALAPAETEVPDAVLKLRLHRQKLALALLAAHRATVRGEPRAAARPASDDDGDDPKAILAEKIAVMRARLIAAGHVDAATDPDAADGAAA